MATKKSIIGYKGFDKDLKCRGMQYEVGKTFTHEGTVHLCDRGLHFVENPFDALSYYPLIGSRFAEVEASDVSDEKDDDSKRVAREIYVRTELNLDGLIKAGFKLIYDSVDWKRAKKSTSATSGNDAHSATSTSDAIACAIGRKSKAKAAKGSWIVLAEWYEGE